MANLTESPIYEPGIFQLEKTTPPLGGAPAFNGLNPSAGHANVQALQLANRTAYLKQQIDAGGSANSLKSDLSDDTDTTKGASLIGFDQGTAYDVLATNKTFPDYASLRLYTGVATTVKIVDSFRTGRFRKISETSAGYTDDGGITIIANNGWVWQRINVGEVHVDWYLDPGWVAGVTDDRPAIQKAVNFLRTTGSGGGGTARFFRKHLIDSGNLVIPDYVSLKGTLDSAGELRFDGTSDYDAKSSQLVINPTYTISLQSGASCTHGLILRKGLDLPFADLASATAGVAAFSGTAFTASGSDTYISNHLVLGFNKVFFCDNFERPRADHIQADCTSGIDFRRIFDIAYVDRCHLWPFTTTHKSYTTGDLNSRSGTGFNFENVGDWSKLTNCFTYGYALGFRVNGCNFVNLLGCGTDGYGAAESTSVGFEISGNSKMTTLIGCQTAAQGRGVVINNNVGGLTSTAAVTKIIGSCFWDNDIKHIDVLSGRAIITSNSFWRSPVAIDVNSSAKATINDNDFEDITTNTISSGSFDNLNIGINRYTNSVNSFGQRFVTEANPVERQQFSGSVAGGIGLQPLRSRGTTAAKTSLALNDTVWQVDPYPHDGSNFIAGGGIRQVIRNTPSSANVATAWIVSTRATAAGSPSDRWVFESDGSLKPVGDATQNFGSASTRINNSYFAVAPTVGSDARYKTPPKEITDAVLDAWEKVDYKSYKLLDAVELKGKKDARVHFGVIAQQVVEAFSSLGLNAADYGLLCHDSWEAVDEVPEQLDGEGNVVVPKQEAIEASDRYSIRYEEALVLESALMRRTQRRLEARIKALEDSNGRN